MLALLFLTFRVLAVPLLAPGGFITDAGPDEYYYLNFAALSSAGYYPFLDYWSDYPPLFPWMAVLAYRASLLFPAWGHPLLPFNAILHWGFVPFDVGVLVLMYAIARRLYDQSQAEWTATAYTASFVPLFVLLAWFDTVALFFMLLAVWGMVRRLPALSGAGVALGFLTKPFPIAVAPAAAQVFRRWPRWLVFGGTAVLVIAAVLVPLFIASPQYTRATIQAPVGGTAPYETVWALLDGVIDFGIVAPLNQRIDPAAAITPFQSRLPWFWISLVFVGLGLYLWTRPISWEDPQRSVAFVGLTWGILTLYSKGFSPQWHLFTVALALLILPGWRGVLYSILLAVLMAWEWPLAYYVFRPAPWVAVAVIIIRTLVTLALTLDFAARVFPDAGTVAAVARRGLPVATQVLIVAAIALAPGMIRAYRRIQTETSTLAPLFETIRADSNTRHVVVTPNHELVGRLAPPLRGTASVHLMPQVYDDAWEPVGRWLDGQTAGYKRVWLVANPDDPFAPTIAARMQSWLDENRCPTAGFDTADGLLVRGYARPLDSGQCPTPDEIE